MPPIGRRGKVIVYHPPVTGAYADHHRILRPLKLSV
jgi:hypothetical protein